MKTNWSSSFLSFIFIVLFFTFNSSFTVPEKKTDGSSEDTVKDIDGNIYNTVKIGSQVWMAKNLNTTKYNDGTRIPNVTDFRQWSTLTTGAYCNYDNAGIIATEYGHGRLYNFYAVNTGKLAPTGWHVPTDNDWTILVNYLIANGYNYDGTKDKNKPAKSLASFFNWELSINEGTPGKNTEDNNSTGFSALPSGYRKYGGTFYDLFYYGYWWSSSEEGTSFASYRYMYYNSSSVGSGNNYKTTGFSVRCVRDY